MTRRQTLPRAIPGFDYRLGKPIDRSRAEWLQEFARLLKAGGRRRIENGETFFHGPDGRIAIEVYENLPAVTP